MALSLRNLSLRKLPPKALAVIAVLVISPVAVAGLAAAGKHSSETGSAGPAAAPVVQAPQSAAETDKQAETQAAAALGQCQSARLVPTGNGWGVPAPSVSASGSTNCNLMYGDSPHRGSSRSGDPDLAIRTLQRNLNYCYGSHLAVDGMYGSNTRAAVKAVQSKHKLTADGIYGPKTRSAMNWRLFKNSTGQWSTGCYSPL
jgi:peptidoglycan hydrolase-like protein with peptidoglycan-binding domain